MIHDLLIVLLATLGTGSVALVITLVAAYRRVSPEFPPLPPVKRDP